MKTPRLTIEPSRRAKLEKEKSLATEQHGRQHHAQDDFGFQLQPRHAGNERGGKPHNGHQQRRLHIAPLGQCGNDDGDDDDDQDLGKHQGVSAARQIVVADRADDKGQRLGKDCQNI